VNRVYTTQNGLIGIIGNAELWATKVQYLNDSAEFSLALRLAQEQLGRRILNANVRNRQALEAMARTEGIALVNIFVACFCRQGDLLSQWRGYARASSGFSIGIKSAGVQEAARLHGFTLGPCIYDRAEQTMIIDEAIDHCLNLDLEPIETAASFEKLLLAVGAFFKDYGFHEEDEWRLVSRAVDIRDEQVAFRPGKSMLTPYFKIPIGTDLRSVIHGILVGPCPHTALSESSVKAILIQAGVTKQARWGRGYEVNVGASTIPYRDW
jgi:hypothetical protein